MKKWNSKNKRRILISLLFTLIGVGFLGMRSVEPLNAADNEETKQKANKADESYNLNVVWGNTIALGTADFEQESAVAFSLVKTGEQYEVVQNFGNGWNAKNFPLNKTKVTVDYFKQPTDGKTLVIDEETTSDSTVTLTGTDIPVEKGDIWGVNGRQKVSIGDVIRVQSNEPTKEWLYKNSENILTAGDFSYQPQIVYYSVTAEGFQALPLNQVEAKKDIPVDWKTPASVVTNRFNSNPKDFLTFDSNPSLDFEKVTFTGEFTDPPNTDTKNKTNVTSTLEVTAQMADSDIAVKYPLKPTFDVSGTEFENWLPYYGKWLNSETETIPKNNAFVMMRSSKTEIVESETSPEIWDNYQNKVLGVVSNSGTTQANTVAYPTNKEQHITFSNVGYYNGESVNVTVSIKPDKPAPDDSKRYSYIGLDGKNAKNEDLFLDISLDKLSEAADVDFQFKNSKGEPIEISGYWTFSNINDVKDVVIPISQIKKIYSISREYEQNGVKYPVRLQYEELETSSWGEKALQLSGVGDKLPNQISATVTYDKQSSFKYRMVYKEKSLVGFDVKYVQGSDAKVEIPDPQGLDQSFDTITAENYPKNDQPNEIEKPINYQFIQFVPYESNTKNFNNRDQAMSWKLPELELSGLAENGWKIFNEDNVDVTNLGLFTFNPDTATITAKIDKNELYNHYFTFQVNFRFDDANPVDPDRLDEKYLTIEDEVKLFVDELSPVKTTFQSKINFAAEAEFEPVYRDPDDGDIVKPIPDSSSQTKNDLLITHKYTEVTPPSIDGYVYANESIPENYTEQPVRYTQAEDNKVQLLYVIGELSFDIPEEMNFQEVSIPTIFQKTKYLQTIDPDWAIKVTDGRSEKQRIPWKLSAHIADQSFYTHTDSEYQGQKADSEYEEAIPLMSNILRFAKADGEVNDLTQSVVIYDSGDEPQAYNNYPIQWTEENTGFFLDLQAYHYYPLGKYKATIDFTVEYVE